MELFTDDHPYYWVSVPVIEFESKFKQGCVAKNHAGYPTGIFYSLKIDSAAKAIYFISGHRDFDFSKLSHYEETSDA